MLHKKLRLGKLRNLFKIIQQTNGKPGVQILDYKVLKPLLLKIRSIEKEFSMIEICCQVLWSTMTWG